jgi:hypothetical protein
MSSKVIDQIQLFDESDTIYGKTYGAWTVEWWQWALSVPSNINPLIDQSGRYWNTAQPSLDVWFLVGSIGGIDKTFAHRNIRIDSGRSILFPVLNCEANSLEYPDLKTHDDLLKHVGDDVDTIIKKDVFINGMRLNPTRVPSDPRIFNVTINEDNAFRITNPGSTDAAADGYWIFLKPLPRGSYTIQFEGSCEFGRLNAGASYEIEIV